MATTIRLLSCCLALGAAVGCSKGSSGSAATTGDAPSGTASAAAVAADGGKPAPPKDAATSCTVKFSGTVPPKGGPEYTVTNTGTHELRYCRIEAYAYDKSGKQVAKKSLSYNSTIKPGGTNKENYFPFEDTAKTPGLTYEAVVTSVIFTDNSEWRDWNLAPAERPRGGKK